MEIQAGVQPNCSELVIYIDNFDYDEAIKELEFHKIREVIAKNYYEHNDKIVGEWDDTPVEKGIFPITKEVADLYRTYDYGNGDEQQASSAKLRELGYDPWKSSVMLMEDGTEPNWDYGGSISIRNGHDNHDGPAIVAHQHCQIQLFPLMRKISNIFEREVQGYDGGSNEQYNEWVDSGCPGIKEYKGE